MNFTKLASTTPRTGYVQAGLCKSALKVAFGAAVAMGVLGAGQAQAVAFVDVTVDAHKWRVSTFTGSYNTETSKFNTPPGGKMPWWGSSNSANLFASLVGAQLNKEGSIFGPLFAHTFFHVDGIFDKGVRAWQYDSSSFVNPRLQTGINQFTELHWAQATKIPGPLPILGAAAAFGYSRKLRKRIKSSKPEVISTTAL